MRKWTWRNCAGAGSHPVGINEIPHARARRAARVAPIRLPQAIATRGGHGSQHNMRRAGARLSPREGSYRTNTDTTFSICVEIELCPAPASPPPGGHDDGGYGGLPCNSICNMAVAGYHAVGFLDTTRRRHAMPVRTEGDVHVSSLPHPLHARPLTSPRAPLASLPHPSCSRSSHRPLSSSYRRGSTPCASARPSSPVPPP